ncbi:MAG: AbrB/MazE/SpoVT family DNA-binding domain-containing protein [bacterium]
MGALGRANSGLSEKKLEKVRNMIYGNTMKSGITSITSKGQVTIPKSVRNHLGVLPGQQVEIGWENGHAFIRPVQDRVDELFGSLTPFAVVVSDKKEDIQASLAAHVSDREKKRRKQ